MSSWFVDLTTNNCSFKIFPRIQTVVVFKKIEILLADCQRVESNFSVYSCFFLNRIFIDVGKNLAKGAYRRMRKMGSRANSLQQSHWQFAKHH